MRDVILKGVPGKVSYVVDEPPAFAVRLKAETQAGKRTSSVVGALHGELQPHVPDDIEPIDDVAAKVAGRGIPDNLMQLGQLGTGKQQYIPWMQATYIMVANKQALAFLPQGADVNALTYDQLLQWAKAIADKTGQRRLGFPAGPTGLLARFFQGYFYPSFTGGVVSPFKSADAEKGWETMKALWAVTNPNSTNYDFMKEPLLAGEVWLAWDHVARVKDALDAQPDQFITFPAPAGPKGRGYMPVVAGLAIRQGRARPRGGRRGHRAPDQARNPAEDGRGGRVLPRRESGPSRRSAAGREASGERGRDDAGREGRPAVPASRRPRRQGRRVQQGLHRHLPAHRPAQRAGEDRAGGSGQGARRAHEADRRPVLGSRQAEPGRLPGQLTR